MDALLAQLARLAAENAALRATLRRQAADLVDAAHTEAVLREEIQTALGKLTTCRAERAQDRAHLDAIYARWRSRIWRPPADFDDWTEAYGPGIRIEGD